MGINNNGGAGGSGSVTSVGLSLPAVFNVTGSPVTTSGTLSGAFTSQTANQVLVGPASGGSAPPTFRAIVGADLPTPTTTALGGVLSVPAVSHQWVSYLSTNGTPIQSQPATGDISGAGTAITKNASSSGATVVASVSGSFTTGHVATFADTAGTLQDGGAPGGVGTVTSVALTVPAIFTVSGSPVTTSGTLAIALATESANLVWAGPTTGAAANPTFRSLVGADLPTPTTTTLGGVLSVPSTSHQWVSYVSTNGAPVQSQPATGDISGAGTAITKNASSSGLSVVASVSGTATTGRVAVFADVSGTVYDNNILAASSTMALSGMWISAIANQTITVLYNCPYEIQINTSDMNLSSGSCSAAVDIAGVAVTGLSAIAVTTANAHTTATAANTAATGSSITIVISNVTGAAQNYVFCLNCTRLT